MIDRFPTNEKIAYLPRKLTEGGRPSVLERSSRRSLLLRASQITYHLNRAKDNGLTRDEAGELLGHLALYPGWLNAFPGAPIVKDVIEKRP